jgi:hypothetical protein
MTTTHTVEIDCDGAQGGGLSLTLDGDYVEVDVGIAGWGGPFTANARLPLDELRAARASLESVRRVVPS